VVLGSKLGVNLGSIWGQIWGVFGPFLGSPEGQIWGSAGCPAWDHLGPPRAAGPENCQILQTLENRVFFSFLCSAESYEKPENENVPFCPDWESY